MIVSWCGGGRDGEQRSKVHDLGGAGGGAVRCAGAGGDGDLRPPAPSPRRRRLGRPPLHPPGHHRQHQQRRRRRHGRRAAAANRAQVREPASSASAAWRRSRQRCSSARIAEACVGQLRAGGVQASRQDPEAARAEQRSSSQEPATEKGLHPEPGDEPDEAGASGAGDHPSKATERVHQPQQQPSHPTSAHRFRCGDVRGGVRAVGGGAGEADGGAEGGAAGGGGGAGAPGGGGGGAGALRQAVRGEA